MICAKKHKMTQNESSEKSFKIIQIQWFTIQVDTYYIALNIRFHGSLWKSFSRVCCDPYK